MKIDVIRHGEPIGGSRYRGCGIDVPLSERGWRQMWSAVGNHNPWGAIYSSPMKRCREFAEQLALKNLVPLSVEDDLREVGFGDWEGKTKDELIATDPDGFAAFYENPAENTPPGAEPVVNFQTRVGDVFDCILSNTDAGHLLIVAHAGVIRAVLGKALRLSPEAMYRISIVNAGITQFELTGNRLKLNFINSHY